MGRHRKLGEDICPTDHLLGRYHAHSRQEAKVDNFRHVKHYTFIHNDRRIPEHYVKIKDLPKSYLSSTQEQKSNNMTYEAVRELRRTLEKVEGMLKPLPLTAEENKKGVSEVFRAGDLFNALKDILAIHHVKAEYDSQNKPLPKELKSMWNHVRRAEKHGEKAQRRFDKMRIENPSKAANYFEKLLKRLPMFTHLWSIHDKYILLGKLERNKRRNKLLSESHFGSEKYNKDYRMPESFSSRKSKKRR